MTEYLLNNLSRPVGLLDVTAPDYPVGSNVLQVGADKQFKTLAAAVAASHNGDVILVDAGTYKNDFVYIGKKLTIMGVGGMVNMVATVPCPDGKAIMTVGQDLTLKNFSFSGATVTAQNGANGAGIRYEGGKMVLMNDSFIGNQNGVMGGAGDPSTTRQIVIDHCLFSANGSGTGQTHNIYIGAIDSLTVTNSIFEKAVVGHELKSRALSNTIDSNWFRDTSTGTASYDIDLPNGGMDVVTNNVIEKGPLSQNNAMVHFGGEGLPYADSSLVLQGNTFLNDKNASTIGVLNQSGIPVTIQGNTFSSIAATNIVSGPATVSGNVNQNGVAIANSSTTDPIPGSTVTYTDTAAHSVTLDGSTIAAVRGGAGHLTVFAQAGQIMAIGGAGGMDFTESATSGANQLTTAAGSTNTLTLTGQDAVNSRGNDTITTGALDVSGTISGNARIEGGTAYDKWTIQGTATINGHGGGPFLTLLSGAQAKVTGSLSSLHLNSTGGTASVDITQAGPSTSAGKHISWSVTGGSVAAYIWDGLTNITTAGGAQAATIRVGDGPSYITSNGKDVIWEGTGNGTVVCTTAAQIYAGTGNLSIFGRHIAKGSEAKVYGNGGTYTLDGDTGNIIYYGGDKASTVNLNLSFNTLIGGNGKLTVNGGSAETIIGGAGGLDFYGGTGGANSITTAAGSTNTLRLGGGARVDSWGNDTIIGGTGNDSITVHGNATVGGGTGNRSITLMGNDVLNGLGQDFVTVTRGANVTINAGSYTTVTATGATTHVSVGGAKAGDVTVTGGTAYIKATAADGVGVQTTSATGADIRFGSGPNWVLSAGSDTIHEGSGASTIGISGSNVTIYGGSGAVSARYSNGSVTGIHFIGGSGDATLLVGGGNDIQFGSGTTVVTAEGKLANTFEFVAGSGGGTDTIRGFRVGTDHLVLNGVTVTSQSVSGGAANLVLSDNTHVQLTGVSNLAKLFS